MTQILDHEATATLPDVAFVALRAIYDSVAEDYDLEVLSDATELFAVRTGYGDLRLAPNGSGTEVVIASATVADLHVLQDGFVSAIAHVSVPTAESIRWSQAPAQGALPLNFQFAQAVTVAPLCDGFSRLTLAVPDLAGYTDDALHFRIILPPPGIASPEWPSLKPNGGVAWPKGPSALHMPVYTARQVDPDAGTLDIDIFHHDRGRITEWLKTVRAGDTVAIMGPGGGGIPDAKRIHIFADETAFPAAARMIETLKPDVSGSVNLFHSGGPSAYPMPEKSPFCRVDFAWDKAQAFCAQAEAYAATEPEAYLWFAAEKTLAQSVRAACKQSERARGFFQVTAYWSLEAVSPH